MNFNQAIARIRSAVWGGVAVWPGCAGFGGLAGAHSAVDVLESFA